MMPELRPVAAPAPVSPRLPSMALLLRWAKGPARDWARQPGTQEGLSLFAGGCMLAILHPFPASEGIAATLMAASLPKLLPDNSTDAIRAHSLSAALAHALVTRRGADAEHAAEAAVALMVEPRTG